MGFMKRAYLYITRKKGKSALLFAVLLIMATFVLTGLSVGGASKLAQENLRKSLGGEFSLAVNYSQENPYNSAARVVDVDEPDSRGGNNIQAYTKMPISQKEIDAIMGIDGIDSYDAKKEYFINVEDIDYFPGSVPVDSNMKDMAKAWIIGNTAETSYFRSGSLTLTEGSHIGTQDSHAVIISKDLAELNGLSVGDILSLPGRNERVDRDTLYLSGENIVKVEIVGIFEITDPMLENGRTAEIASQHDMLENKMFFDMNSFRELIPGYPVGFDNVVFNVNDPVQLDGILSRVKAISSIDWRAFVLGVNNQTYLQASAPLEKLDGLIASILAIIAIVSALILSLILTMWAKSRIHETGIFLSVGIGKMVIIGQYLTEALIIAVLAFGLSFFTSNMVAEQVGNSLLRQEIQQATQYEEMQADNTDDEDYATSFSFAGESNEGNISETANSVEDTRISVAIGVYNLIQLYLFGFAIILISVGVSGTTVMRFKPKEILSKMS